MQPEAKAEQMKITKSAPQCYGGKTPHPITLKKLIAVIFEEKGSDYICPVCVKSFGNSAEALVLKPCGHALCKECMNKFCKTLKKCSVCDLKYKAAIKIAIEGTGFAASGITEAVKVTPGFL